MPQLSGSAAVPVSESIAASNIKTQDYLFNPPAAGFSLPLISVSDAAGTPTSGTVATGQGSINFTTFTASGRTITAAGSGVFAPLGFFAVQVSGSTCVVPFFAK